MEPLNRVLDRGGMLAIPTESTYALAVDPCNSVGVAAVYRLKGRSANKPLPVVMGRLDQLRELGGDPGDPQLGELASLWPAPLTIVVPIQKPLPATVGTCSLAVRIPVHQRLRQLLCQLDRPLTATSANLSGDEPVSEREELLNMLAEWPVVMVDDGDLAGGRPSTIVEPGEQGLRVHREGAIPISSLAALVSMPIFSAAPAEIFVDDRQQHR